MTTTEHGVKKLISGIESLRLTSKVRKKSRVSKARRAPKMKSPLHGKFRLRNRVGRLKLSRKSHECFTPKGPFARLVKEVMSSLNGSTKDLEMTKDATNAVLAMESSGPTPGAMNTEETSMQTHIPGGGLVGSKMQDKLPDSSSHLVIEAGGAVHHGFSMQT